MLNYAVIGTNWISAKFIAAAQENDQLTLHRIYSRTQTSGERFASQHQLTAPIETDFTALLQDAQLDLVYIASPNHLHGQQALAALQAGKHVIVEKPAVVTPAELHDIQIFLDHNPHLFYFEAAKHTFLPSFQTVQDALSKIGPLRGGTLTYMDDASDLLQNNTTLPTLFSRQAARGVLFDLGVYLLHDAVSWFGAPDAVSYRADLLPHEDGADIFGIGQLHYGSATLNLVIGNQNKSTTPSELYGAHGTLVINHPTHFDEVTLWQNGQATALPVTNPANTMAPEVTAFVTAIQTNNREQMLAWLSRTAIVSQLLHDMRLAAGITFPLFDK